jgi:nitroreductase
VELFEAIKSRRSIRRYTTEDVGDDKINAILEAGRWAPSWANTQCWRFIVVRDPKIRADVADAFIPTGLPDEKANRAVGMINTAPVLIVVCAAMRKSGGKLGGGPYEPMTDKGDWFMFDAALAVENMALAAHALGLGTVILGTFNAGKVEKVLGVPQGYRVVTMFPVGVPTAPGKVPPRKELSEIVYRERWE